MMDFATSGTDERAPPHLFLLDRFPDWSRFPIFMLAVTILLVTVFSVFIHNDVVLMVPACVVCAMAAIANRLAQCLGLDQD